MPVIPSRPAAVAVGFTVAMAILLAGCDGEPASPSGKDRTEHGWTATVYYTAVEYFHDGHHEQVRGCAQPECVRGDTDLGAYPASFVKAVHDEGAGRLTSGAHAGKYLNWSSDSGYWLDDFARDTHGQPLVPFRTAAADGLPEGTSVRLISCGTGDAGRPPPLDVCQRLSDPTWLIRDAFTPGLGGKRHIDLYIGEEDKPYFTDSQLFTTLHNTLLRIN